MEPEAVEAAIADDLAVLLLTEVDYRTGRRHDMRRLTARAHAAGGLAVWDLAHSAGAIPVALASCAADFAVGCGYKYLNGGPGAPAFVYVAPRLAETVEPALCGWMGHAAPFAFDLGYRPATGVERMRVGTPSVLALTALDAARDAFDGVDMAAVQAKSASLCELFLAGVEGCAQVELATPRDDRRRGSQLSFRCAEGYAVMQALIARGVIGDFREPDFIRFGFTPLYTSHAEAVEAASVLVDVLRHGLWDRPEYRLRAKGT